MDDAAKKIIKDIAIHRPRNLIITEVCETYKLQWADAEDLVNKIEREHASIIYSKQRPLYIFLGSLLTASGLALAGSVLIASVNGWTISFFSISIPTFGNAVLFILGILVLIGSFRWVIKMTKK